MGIQGNLLDMSVADLIQQYCQDRRTAQLKIEHSGRQAFLYFDSGNVSHAVLEDRMGEDVIFEILQWKDGNFDLETGVQPPRTSITRTWSGLLLEAARRIDEEERKAMDVPPQQTGAMETHKMMNLGDVLKEMSGEVSGYIASSLMGLDGLMIASDAGKNAPDQESFGAQMTVLLKLVNISVEKLRAGVVEDNLITTETTYILLRFLPDKQYYLCITADRKTSNLGNMRLMSKVYAERLSKAMMP
jgi:predicted regulator of Ras-like GTPase activity (Roadblock/LC7/MglB family)